MNRFGKLKQTVARLWRKYVPDECPDEKAARLRDKRISNILHDVIILETMRRWEIENQSSPLSKN